MNYILITIRDRAVEAYMPLGSVRAEGEALRIFTDLLSDPKQQHSQHPDDYDLYIVGKFNDQDGTITPETPPRKIGDGKAIAATFKGE